MKSNVLKKSSFQFTKARAKFALLSFAFLIVGFILPWWSIVLVALVAGSQNRSIKSAFSESFLACGLAWFILAFYFDARTGFRLAPRIGGLMKLPYPILPTILVAITGAILAGFAAVAAHSFLATLRTGNNRP